MCGFFFSLLDFSRKLSGPCRPAHPVARVVFSCPRLSDADATAWNPTVCTIGLLRYKSLRYSITNYRSFATLQELVHFYQHLNVEFQHPFSLKSPGMRDRPEEVDQWPQQRLPQPPLRGPVQPAQPVQPFGTVGNRSFVGQDHAFNPRGVGLPGGRPGDRTALLGGGRHGEGGDGDCVGETGRGRGRDQGGGGEGDYKWTSEANAAHCRVSLVVALLLVIILAVALFLCFLYIR